VGWGRHYQYPTQSVIISTHDGRSKLNFHYECNRPLKWMSNKRLEMFM